MHAWVIKTTFRGIMMKVGVVECSMMSLDTWSYSWRKGLISLCYACTVTFLQSFGVGLWRGSPAQTAPCRVPSFIQWEPLKSLTLPDIHGCGVPFCSQCLRCSEDVSSWTMCVFAGRVGLLEYYSEDCLRINGRSHLKPGEVFGYRQNLRSLEHKEISRECSVFRARRGWQRDLFEGGKYAPDQDGKDLLCFFAFVGKFRWACFSYDCRNILNSILSDLFFPGYLTDRGLTVHKSPSLARLRGVSLSWNVFGSINRFFSNVTCSIVYMC